MKYRLEFDEQGQPHVIGRKRLKPSPNTQGYLFVVLSNKTKRINKPLHRLVAEKHIPNPNNLPQVNHINGNKLDNRIDNLEWCTSSENIQHAYDMGRKPNRSTPVYTIGLGQFKSTTEASKATGISIGNIHSCIKGTRQSAGGYRWKKIKGS